jgi:fimbrial chaperone protein
MGGLVHTRRWMGAALVAVALVPCGRASAATFSVNPTQISLSARASSALLTLRNDSDETLRFQLSAFDWTQGVGGEIQLAATDQVIFFPALLTLAPKEERRIRIGTTAVAGVQEKSYRVFVEELPSADASRTGAAVRVLTKMGIPVFVRPARESAAATLADLGVRAGTLRFSVGNTGTVHIIPQKIRVRGVGARGEAVFEREVTGWYILPGGRRDFELPLPPADCARLSSVQIDATFEAMSVKESLQTPAGACAR